MTFALLAIAMSNVEVKYYIINEFSFIVKKWVKICFSTCCRVLLKWNAMAHGSQKRKWSRVLTVKQNSCNLKLIPLILLSLRKSNLLTFYIITLDLHNAFGLFDVLQHFMHFFKNLWNRWEYLKNKYSQRNHYELGKDW